MMWSSGSEFLAMGGYGLYVWGSYLMCLAMMLVEPLMARRHRSSALQAAGPTHVEENKR